MSPAREKADWASARRPDGAWNPSGRCRRTAYGARGGRHRVASSWARSCPTTAVFFTPKSHGYRSLSSLGTMLACNGLPCLGRDRRFVPDCRCFLRSLHRIVGLLEGKIFMRLGKMRETFFSPPPKEDRMAAYILIAVLAVLKHTLTSESDL